ncbi:chalcone isomerase family protein [Aromatoleum toluclasticum]|uniref:chalcone isomerase family protein n=1 Tax=Aromatoleum toluclasticum TaxID=92003 RepID=UPI001D18FBF6|nr:chalcone isomerase family protein [Aromatoleum toluclasticum]MCC4117367.1 chalcone isomerase family protein [Aromatoleum toluclasticum]
MKGWHRLREATLIAALSAAAPLHAAEVAGVHVDDRIRVGTQELALNGAGIRSKLFIKVYVGALYTSARATTPEAVYDAAGPRRISLHLLRDLDAQTLHEALDEGLRKNLSAAELAALKGPAGELAVLMKSIGQVRRGTVIAIDFGAEGLAVDVDGAPRGQVAGGAFAKALLRVWLGDKPADADLKQALLGG